MPLSNIWRTTIGARNIAIRCSLIPSFRRDLNYYSNMIIRRVIRITHVFENESVEARFTSQPSGSYVIS